MELNELSKKEKGRVKAVLTQSRLSMFNTDEKMNSEARNTSLCNSLSNCSPETKNLLDAFLCSSNSEHILIKLLNTIDSNGIESIAKICENPDNIEKTSLRTIYGGTEKMPFRALAYMLPALNICEQIQKNTGKKNVPNIEFFFMNGAGMMANDLDPEQTYKASFQFINVARKYIREFHPSLDEKVNFYIDRSFTSNIMKTPEYKQIYKIFEDKLTEKEALRGDLLEMGERRNAAINSIKYAALHIFSQDGFINPEVARMYDFEHDKPLFETDYIISIGAKPEEKFYQARKTLVDSMKAVSYFAPKKTAQYIANFNVPPYSPLKEGELYMQDVMKNPELIMKARAKNGINDFSDYQTPVQKAVELLIEDTENSTSQKSLIEFVEDLVEEKERN